MALFGNITLPDRPDPENIRKLDMLRVPMVVKMMRYGSMIDKEHFESLSFDLNKRMDELRRDITGMIPPAELDRFCDILDTTETEQENDEERLVEIVRSDFAVNSSKQIAELLYDVFELHLSTSVQIKKTKGGDRLSTGKKTLEQLKRDHPVVPAILEYRECSKLDGTYAKTMPRKAKYHPAGKDCPVCGRRHWQEQWRVHTRIKTTRTGSGRTAMDSPNLSNIPARTKRGAQIRAGFVAPYGSVLSQRDLSQIELRLMADRSGDETMIGIYRSDGDIHIATAAGTFSLDYNHLMDLLAKKDTGSMTPEEKQYWDEFSLYMRAPSKNTNFAVCYLITGLGLLDLMAVTFATANKPLPDYMNEDWCDDFIQKWFGLYKGAKTYLDSEEEKIRQYGIAWTPMGRVRRVPEVRSCHQWIQEAGVRQGSNHGIQGFSADVMALIMGELDYRLVQLENYGIETFPTLTIYDELLIECDEENGETTQAVTGEVMDNCLTDKSTGVNMCKVPIKSEGKLLTVWTK